MKKIMLIFYLLFNIVSFSKVLVFSEMRNVDGELVIVLAGYQTEYLVKKGDTVESIAKKFKMTVEELMKRNHLNSPEDLKVDMVLMVDIVEEKDEKNIIDVKYDY